MIGVDGTLAPPSDFKTICECSKTAFAYPTKVEVESKKLKEKMPKAMLSTSRKKKTDEASNADKGAEVDKMDEDTVAAPGETSGADAVMDNADKVDDAATASEKEDASRFELGNPARVVPMQREFVRLMDNNRWRPVRFQQAGILVLKNSKPDDPVEYAFADEEKVQETATGEEPAAEPAPEPFDYVPS